MYMVHMLGRPLTFLFMPKLLGHILRIVVYGQSMVRKTIDGIGIEYRRELGVIAMKGCSWIQMEESMLDRVTMF